MIEYPIHTLLNYPIRHYESDIIKCSPLSPINAEYNTLIFIPDNSPPVELVFTYTIVLYPSERVSGLVSNIQRHYPLYKGAI